MAWQLRLASPSAAAGGAPTLPLPDPPLKEMCMLPVGAPAVAQLSAAAHGGGGVRHRMNAVAAALNIKRSVKVVVWK